MGIFTEADRHPFSELDADVSEQAHGGAGNELGPRDLRWSEFVRSTDQPRFFIRDESLAS